MVPSHIQQENVAKLASLIVSWRSRPAFWSSSIKQQTWLTILFVGFLDLRNLRLPPCWSILNITKLRQLKEKSYKVQKTVFLISWYQPRNHIERAIIFNVSFMDSLLVRKNDVEWNNRDYKLDERSTIESSAFPSIINDKSRWYKTYWIYTSATDVCTINSHRDGNPWRGTVYSVYFKARITKTAEIFQLWRERESKKELE